MPSSTSIAVPSMISCLGMPDLLPPACLSYPHPYFAPDGLAVARISRPATSPARPIQNTFGS